MRLTSKEESRLNTYEVSLQTNTVDIPAWLYHLFLEQPESLQGRSETRGPWEMQEWRCRLKKTTLDV